MSIIINNTEHGLPANHIWTNFSNVDGVFYKPNGITGVVNACSSVMSDDAAKVNEVLSFWGGLFKLSPLYLVSGVSRAITFVFLGLILSVT